MNTEKEKKPPFSLEEQKVLEEARQYIEKLFSSDSSGHDAEHSLRVYRMAVRIASEEEGANVYLVALAALLHDVDDVKLFPDHRFYENAYSFMSKEGVPLALQERVTRIISQVSFKGKDTMKPDTLEGEIVQDADRLDAIGAIGIGRAFAYGGSHHRKLYDPNEKPMMEMDEATYRSRHSSTITHFYEKLLLLKDMMNTKAAKRIAEHRQKVMKDFLREFQEETEGKDGIVEDGKGC